MFCLFDVFFDNLAVTIFTTVLGALVHGVYPLESGMRTNLIVWGRSSFYRTKGIVFTRSGRPEVTFKLDPTTITKLKLAEIGQVKDLVLLTPEADLIQFDDKGVPISSLDPFKFYTICDKSEIEALHE